MLERMGARSFGYYRGGLYATNLQPFLDLFPRERFRFILFDDLRADFAGSMRGVHEFLGIRGREAKEIRSNPASQPVTPGLREYLRKPSGIPGFFMRLVYRRLSPERRHNAKLWNLNAIRRPTTYPPMEPQVEAELREKYAEEVGALGAIMDRDPSRWLPR